MKTLKRTLEYLTLGSFVFLAVCIFSLQTHYRHSNSEEAKIVALESELRTQAIDERDPHQSEIKIQQADALQKVADTLTDQRLMSAYRLAVVIAILAAIGFASLVGLFVVNLARKSPSPSPS